MSLTTHSEALPEDLPESPPDDSSWSDALASVLRSPGSRPRPLPLVVTALLGAAVYGTAAGFYQGGGQILVAALKAPLIVGLAWLLCLPSFLVFHLVAGSELRISSMLRVLAGFGAVVGALLAALTPVSWLFSLTSRYLGALGFFHLVIWGVSLGFGLRHLFAAFPRASSRWAAFWWVCIFWLVSVQLFAYLGPVLYRGPEEPLFPLERGSFLVHWDRAMDQELD